MLLTKVPSESASQVHNASITVRCGMASVLREVPSFLKGGVGSIIFSYKPGKARRGFKFQAVPEYGPAEQRKQKDPRPDHAF